MAASGYSAVVDRLMTALGRLPGIGARSAERLAHHLLKCPPEEALELAEAIRAAKDQIRHCQVCFHLTEADQPHLLHLPRPAPRSVHGLRRRAVARPDRDGEGAARSTASITSCWAAWPRCRAWARSN